MSNTTIPELKGVVFIFPHKILCITHHVNAIIKYPIELSPKKENNAFEYILIRKIKLNSYEIVWNLLKK